MPRKDSARKTAHSKVAARRRGHSRPLQKKAASSRAHSAKKSSRSAVAIHDTALPAVARKSSIRATKSSAPKASPSSEEVQIGIGPVSLAKVHIERESAPNLAGATQRYVLLPDVGLRVAPAVATTANVLGNFIQPIADFLRSLASARNLVAVASSVLPAVGSATRVAMKVLDSVAENGAKLVELNPSDLSSLRAIQPGLRIVPIQTYRPAFVRRSIREPHKSASGRLATAISLKIAIQGAGPAEGATVVAFTDFDARRGAQGTVDSSGTVSLNLASGATVEALYVYPRLNSWGLIKRNLTINDNDSFALPPVDLKYADALRHFYRPSATDGGGVRVAVVDTGVGPHPDLLVEGGANTIYGEDPNAYQDNGEFHGTHVAGIIAGRNPNRSGLAPAVAVRSYRVFPAPNTDSDSFAISKAIDRAVQDKCDLINLSLKINQNPNDPVLTQIDQAVSAAIDDARRAGALVIVAAGNDGRKAVAFPANDSLAIGVSAMGRRGTFVAGSTEEGDVADDPAGSDASDFIAEFSNIGPEIDVTAPGVGILSTVPGGYVPMSGTSMACPATTGIAARILASNKKVLEMPRNAQRRDEIAKILLASTRSLGFKAEYQGQGLVT